MIYTVSISEGLCSQLSDLVKIVCILINRAQAVIDLPKKEPYKSDVNNKF